MSNEGNRHVLGRLSLPRKIALVESAGFVVLAAVVLASGAWLYAIVLVALGVFGALLAVKA